MYFGLPHRTTSQIDLRNRKSLALVAMLVLILGVFVLIPREAWADQQQPTVVHQVSVKSNEEHTGLTHKGVAPPAAEAPSVVSHTVEATFPAMPLPRGSTPESMPKPIPESAPNSLPKSALNSTLEPKLQADPASEKPRSELPEEPTLPVSEPTLSASVPSSEPMPEPVSLEEVVSETLLLHSTESLTAPLPQDLGPAPLPEDAPADPVALIGATSQNPDYNAAALGPNGPFSLAGASPSTTSLGTIELNVVSNALQPVQNATAGVAAENLGTLADDSYEPFTNHNREPSESSPQQPAPLPAPPMGGSSFSLAGGGQAGAGGVVPLLLVVLASGLILLRVSGRLSQAFCEILKPSSALLMPLERPG